MLARDTFNLLFYLSCKSESFYHFSFLNCIFCGSCLWSVFEKMNVFGKVINILDGRNPSLVQFKILLRIHKIKATRNKFKEDQLNSLESLEKCKPKEFWNKVRKLVAKNQQQQDNFSSQEYLEYFKKLLSTNNSNDDIDQQYLDYVENSLPAIESSTTDIRGP